MSEWLIATKRLCAIHDNKHATVTDKVAWGMVETYSDKNRSSAQQTFSPFGGPSPCADMTNLHHDDDRAARLITVYHMSTIKVIVNALQMIAEEKIRMFAIAMRV